MQNNHTWGLIITSKNNSNTSDTDKEINCRIGKASMAFNKTIKIKSKNSL